MRAYRGAPPQRKHPLPLLCAVPALAPTPSLNSNRLMSPDAHKGRPTARNISRAQGCYIGQAAAKRPVAPPPVNRGGRCQGYISRGAKPSCGLWRPWPLCRSTPQALSAAGGVAPLWPLIYQRINAQGCAIIRAWGCAKGLTPVTYRPANCKAKQITKNCGG